jgi:kumamolisin
MHSSLRRHRPLGRGVLPAIATIAVVLSVSTGAATAATAGSSAGSGGTITVPQGASALPIDSGQPLGDTDPSTPVDISIILAARNAADLHNRVLNGWSGRYLTTSQFAAQYGQSPAVIHGIQAYLAHYGITSSAYADGLDISANGTAGQVNQALGVHLQNYRIKSNPATYGGKGHFETVYGSRHDPQVPSSVGSPILAILGLSNYTPFNSQAIKATHKPVSAAAQAAAGSGIPDGDGLAPADFVNHYSLASLENHGAKGQGTTIGIITLATIDPSVPLAFWNNVLGLNVPASRLNLIELDGGAGAISTDNGSDESDLDVEQSGAIAPRANVRVYEAPNTGPGFADAFYAAASDNVADTVSISWGESETYLEAAIASATEPATYAAVFDQAMAEMGAQGQSSFVASGDSGAYDATADLGTTNLAVDTPSDSPFTTSAGGTTLAGTQTYGLRDSGGNPNGDTATVNIPKERAWGWDYLIAIAPSLGITDQKTAYEELLAGSGGGYSNIEPRPSYQQGISAYNDRQFIIPTDPQEVAPGLVEATDFDVNSTPSLGSGFAGSGRGGPDVSTNGDPQTGYAVYDPALFGGDGYAQYGGTSFVAPQLNGATAVIDSALGGRVGFWNPTIYPAAAGRHSPFTPIQDTTVYSGVKYLYQTDTSGNVTALPGEFTNTNMFYTGKPGADWNPAVGLGIPNLSALALTFAGH